MYGGDENATFSVIGKVNIRPIIQCSLDAGAETPIRQKPLSDVRHQDRIADIRNARTDFLHSQVIRQISRTDDLNAVVENENTDRRVYEIVSVN